jgi:alkyl sulfatase BDS1-like metallo-beta-lactamase superfamily hydrolase
MSQLVFAEPDNREARELAADAYEQLGYLAESATWRNAYLVGAWELRNGMPTVPPVPFLVPDVFKALPIEALFDYMGVRINGNRAQGKRLVSNWIFTDSRERFVLNLENGALTYVANKQTARADVTLTLTRETLAAALLGDTTFGQAAQTGAITVGGDTNRLNELVSLMDDFEAMFEIIEPKRKAR